jgi:hypothetical protein
MNHASTVTKADTLKAAIGVLAALAEVIRAKGSIPSGELYAQVCGALSLQTYESAIGLLVRSSLVTRDATHLLTWIGPKS